MEIELKSNLKLNVAFSSEQRIKSNYKEKAKKNSTEILFQTCEITSMKYIHVFLYYICPFDNMVKINCGFDIMVYLYLYCLPVITYFYCITSYFSIKITTLK